MKGLARLAVVAALAFAPVAARADMKALEEAAKKEGELTWYTAHYTSEGAEELGAEFTKVWARHYGSQQDAQPQPGKT